jgi:hypothetical protein
VVGSAQAARHPGHGRPSAPERLAEIGQPGRPDRCAKAGRTAAPGWALGGLP